MSTNLMNKVARGMGVAAHKRGMTRVFVADQSIPVTVVEVKPNRVTQLKTLEKEGYCAVQVTWGEQKSSRLGKPEVGHFAKANVLPGLGLKEFRVLPKDLEKLSVGDEITAALFKAGQMVDVVGTTKGRGFTGVIQRHNFSSQRASHGNSLSHNAPGSIGQNQSPGRVFKGKKMAGRYGNERQTIQNLEIVRVDLERNVLLIKGAVPGAPGGEIFIYPAVKVKQSKSTEAA